MDELSYLPAIARQRETRLRREAESNRLAGGGWRARRRRQAATEPVRVSGWLLRLTDAELVVLGAELENVIAAHRRAEGAEPGATPVTVRVDALRGWRAPVFEPNATGITSHRP
ncbi:MAG TPA: hypothetical protein VHX38_39400 [Pseudonocardiaceae bacterium]|jgi:hypothetical protein|nr:hypothetical protein [Pseudonocardiaceae bacterium]